MSKIAFVFPGQGSQISGMGKSFYDNFEVSKEVFDFADKILGIEISKICFEGSDDELKQTISSQPAILTTSLAAYKAFAQKSNIKPDYVLGHSLGEITAYSVANILSLEDTFKLIQSRAKFMNEAANSTEGKMLAVIGASLDVINSCIEKVEGYVAIANYNSPIQVVLTGEATAIDEVAVLLKEAGIRKVVPLAVSGAFHSALMKSAAESLEKIVSDTSFNDASCPVITNVDACVTEFADEFRQKVVSQIYSSVRWTESIENAVKNGVDTFVEFGEGKVLSGLIKKINPDVIVYNVSNLETLEFTVQSLGENYGK